MPKEVGPPHFEGEEVNGGRNTRWSGVVLTDAAVRAIGIVYAGSCKSIEVLPAAADKSIAPGLEIGKTMDAL
jgi:hypothetical protein